MNKIAGPVWAVLEYAWYPLLLFVTTPWFLRELGTEAYGHWMLLNATVGVGAVLNSGTGIATIKAVSAALARRDAATTQRVVRISLAVSLVGGVALGMLIFGIYWFGGQAFLERMGDPSLVRATAVAAALLILLEQLDNVASSAMKGAELFGLVARIEIASKTVQIAAALVVVSTWPSLWLLYSALVTVAVLRLATKFIAAARALKLSDLRPSLRGGRELLPLAGWGWIQGIGTTLFGVADRIIVGSLLGAASLSYYSIASQLAMQVHAVAAAALSVVFPMVSRRLISQAGFSLSRVATVTALGGLALSTAVAVALLWFGGTILELWIGADLAEGTAEVLWWLVFAYWLLSLNVVPYYILLGMGRVGLVAVTVVAAGLIATASTFMTVTVFGLVGAPVGRGIYAVATLALLVPVARHLVEERRGKSAQRRAEAELRSENPL